MIISMQKKSGNIYYKALWLSSGKQAHPTSTCCQRVKGCLLHPADLMSLTVLAMSWALRQRTEVLDSQY